MKKFARTAVLGIVLSGTAGCIAGPRSPSVAQEDARINIEVINHSFSDATLYAIFEGKRTRLGIVTGAGTAQYVLPWDRSLELQIHIDLLAGPECTTRRMWVDSGEIILLEIEAELRRCGA